MPWARPSLLSSVSIAAGESRLPSSATASSHREAPLIADDPAADNTDVYAFVSPDKPNTVTIIANYIPFEDPAGGPNFASFDDNVVYSISIDNDGDSKDDIDFQFKSRLLEGLMKANFHHAVERLMGCFEARAKALYG